MYLSSKEQIENARKHINIIKDFINHNEKLNYIDENMTIKEFKEYLNNVDIKYLKVIEEINSIIKSKLK